jgi:hypothetical protein
LYSPDTEVPAAAGEAFDREFRAGVGDLDDQVALVRDRDRDRRRAVHERVGDEFGDDERGIVEQVGAPPRS